MKPILASYRSGFREVDWYDGPYYNVTSYVFKNGYWQNTAFAGVQMTLFGSAGCFTEGFLG